MRPDISDRPDLHVDDRSLQLLYFGPAHTTGDGGAGPGPRGW
ncbi:hypothetical protein ACFVYP_27390 [Kitasatospora sp. NPDC058201]